MECAFLPAVQADAAVSVKQQREEDHQMRWWGFSLRILQNYNLANNTQRKL